MNPVNVQEVINISRDAAQRIMAIYHQADPQITLKADQSPVTQADMASHEIISQALQALYPNIPVISEEMTDALDYAVRKTWNAFFLVDPLDGTKEFIQRNGEFTINIALIQHGQPVLGIIHAPALDVIYYAELGKGAYKIQHNQIIKLPSHIRSTDAPLRVAVSRSHSCTKTQEFLEKLHQQGKSLVIVSSGSALKFGLAAEGSVDIYVRFTPTMEWDTAAGQILVHEAKKKMTLIDRDEALQYNKIDLRNPGFIVKDIS